MRYQQPQAGPARIDQGNPITRAVALAYLPSLGFTNLATGSGASQSVLPTIGVSPVGTTFDGGGRGEFPAVGMPAGFTIISIWRAKAAGYLSGDGTRFLLSTRTSGNAGWSYGRTSAIGGGATGNLTKQSMAFQGIAQYDEANYTIESLVDTPVACRYDPVTGKISWFRFGQRSSPDTTVGTPSAGGTLVFGAQGPFSANLNPWLDRVAGALVIARPLSDAEIYALTNSVQALWQVFASPQRVLAVAVPAAGTNVSPLGAAVTLTGYAPTITQPQSVAPGAASITLTGYAPAVSQAVVLSPSGAAVTLTGYAPVVGQSVPQTIAPFGAVLAITGYAPTVTQYSAPAPAGDGGGAGNVREVRRFADLLDRAHKPTRSQKKKRRKELEAEALELLPDLPEAAELAPVAARIVFEQEAAARATAYANRPIEAMSPVVVPFDAHAALRDLIAKLMADEHMRHELEAEDEFETELLLLGS